MFRSEIENLESQPMKTETIVSNSETLVQKGHGSVPVMDVVDRLRLNLFKMERLQSKLNLALGEVAHIMKKK